MTGARNEREPGRGPRALVIGAVSRDLDGTNGGPCRPGGVVVHAGTALARLGARTQVVTRVRPEDAPMLLAPLVAAGVETLALPSRATTTYANDYGGPVDRHELLAASDPIRPGDVPAAWRDADLIQLGPLHPADVLPETAAVVRGFVGLDVQGLVRVAGSEGTRLVPFPRLRDLLAHVHVVQTSEYELPALLDGTPVTRFVARHAVTEMIVTRGPRGATLITRGTMIDVPGRPIVSRAAVGAGDVFLAAYLVHRVQGQSPRASAAAATRLTAQYLACPG